MSTPVRLLAFAAALAAVFVLALVGARTLLPADLAQAGQDRTGHSSSNPEKDSQMDHTTASTPSAQHSEDSHDEHGQAPAADPVRGLTVAQDGYQLGALTAPAAVGEDGTLSFRLTGPDGKPVTDYTTAHDKDLHLIVVRSDGSRFRHVHPSDRRRRDLVDPVAVGRRRQLPGVRRLRPRRHRGDADADQHPRRWPATCSPSRSARTPPSPPSTGSPSPWTAHRPPGPAPC